MSAPQPGREQEIRARAELRTEAIAFAVRAGHPDAMVHRFVEALDAQGVMGQTRQYRPLLAQLMRSETEAGR